MTLPSTLTGPENQSEYRLVEWTPFMTQVVRDVLAGERDRFVAAGYKAGYFFPHRIRFLPRCGPDGALLALQMAGISSPDALWQIVIHALPPSIDEFPREIFFDRDLLWHQQHCHEPGQIASVTVGMQGDTLYTMVHQSDLVQRISRRREYKTRIERVFRGWHHMLLNAVAGFAVEQRCTSIRVPTARLMMKFTDRSRSVQPELFERVYDRVVHHHFAARETDGWWSIDVAANMTSIVTVAPTTIELAPAKTVCLFHDIERGLGHRQIAADFGRVADRSSDASLTRMLALEKEAGVRATYVVVGTLMNEVRDRIEMDETGWRGTAAGGHALGFHSFDHDLRNTEQLNACRDIDYRLKGYRPPQSRLTPELDSDQLCRHNFEWLASSASSLGFDRPRLEHRIARIPVHADDFELYAGQRGYSSWRKRLLQLIRENDFVAVGLHDCYGPYWLPHYAELLRDIQSLAAPRTMDEVADELFVAGGI